MGRGHAGSGEHSSWDAQQLQETLRTHFLLWGMASGMGLAVVSGVAVAVERSSPFLGYFVSALVLGVLDIGVLDMLRLRLDGKPRGFHAGRGRGDGSVLDLVVTHLVLVVALAVFCIVLPAILAGLDVVSGSSSLFWVFTALIVGAWLALVATTVGQLLRHQMDKTGRLKGWNFSSSSENDQSEEEHLSDSGSDRNRHSLHERRGLLHRQYDNLTSDDNGSETYNPGDRENRVPSPSSSSLPNPRNSIVDNRLDPTSGWDPPRNAQKDPNDSLQTGSGKTLSQVARGGWPPPN